MPEKKRDYKEENEYRKTYRYRKRLARLRATPWADLPWWDRRFLAESDAQPGMRYCYHHDTMHPATTEYFTSKPNGDLERCKSYMKEYKREWRQRNVAQRERDARVRKIRAKPEVERNRRERRFLAEYEAGPGYRYCGWHGELHAVQHFTKREKGKNGIDFHCRKANKEQLRIFLWKKKQEESWRMQNGAD